MTDQQMDTTTPPPSTSETSDAMSSDEHAVANSSAATTSTAAADDAATTMTTSSSTTAQPSDSADDKGPDYQPPPGVEPHPEWEEIVRQVEFYFSDENLPQDAHLLSKTGNSGDGWVSLNEILSFKKMRAFKPPQKVKVALHKSDKLEIWRSKMIRRKEPLHIPLRVTPKIDMDKERNKTIVEKPWLTKNMLKPTGFEEYATEGPLAPADYEQDRKLYDPEESFVVRIETAVVRFLGRRKMHQHALQIFSKFLTFGGFSSGPRMFVGGMDAKDLEGYSKDEIARMKAQFAVSEAAADGIDPDFGSGTWVVDFETTAKAFFSCHFMGSFNWKDEKTVGDSTNIIRNFYNFLLLHDVCPEYEDQIYKAIDVCNITNEELSKLSKVDDVFPGNFNKACSTVHNGAFADARPSNPDADWVVEGDFQGLSDKDARAIFFAGVTAYCDDDSLLKVATALKADKCLEIVSEEMIGLEVISVEFATPAAMDVYGDERFKDTLVKPTGKLHCVWWDPPHAPPRDVPEYVEKELKAKRGTHYEFIADDDMLRNCEPGIKFEAVVKELETGLRWIDSFEYLYPSFYTWTFNERIRDYKEPGPPKAWQERQNVKKKSGQDESMEMVRREDEEADETPD